MTRRLFPTLATVACAAAPLPAIAQPAGTPSAGRCIDHASEAASRARLSVDIVLRVMRAESGGRAGVVSPKGAMGCMQIMPATWAYLTRRYRLGDSAFDARMNMIGGALYLAELAARYGFPGAYSAYNAGPGRYERFVANGVALPAETIAYVARLSGNAPTRVAVPAAPRWQDAALFIARSEAQPSSTRDADNAGDGAALRQADPAPGGLFPLAAAARRDGGE